MRRPPTDGARSRRRLRRRRRRHDPRLHRPRRPLRTRTPPAGPDRAGASRISLDCRPCSRAPAGSPRCASVWAPSRPRPRARAGTPASRRSRTAPRASSRRRSRSWRASGSAGSAVTRRSGTGWRRSSLPGSAIQAPWRSWSRGRPLPTSAASSSRTRRRLGWPPCQRGEVAARGSSSPACRRCSSTPSLPTTCPRSRASSASAPASARAPCCGSCLSSATRRSSRSPVAASSPAGAASSTSSHHRRTSRYASNPSATRSTRSARSTRQTSAPPGSSIGWCSFRRRSSSCPTAVRTPSAPGLDRPRNGSPSGLPRTSSG